MLCDLQIISGDVYPSSATSRTISFLFRIVFGIYVSKFINASPEDECAAKPSTDYTSYLKRVCLVDEERKVNRT